MSDIIPLKRCSSCPGSEENKWHPATTEFFHRDKGRKDGLCHRCKECSKKHTQHHYKEHPEYYQQYAQEHVEQNRQHVRNYQQSHIPQLQLHRETHREYYQQTSKQWRKDHPEQARAQTLTRIARKKAVPGLYTAAQIVEQLKRQRYCCYYAACGFAKFKKVKGKYVYEVDHTFPLSRVAGTGIPANSISYLVLACPSCNSKKHNKYPHEWIEGGRLL